MGLILRTSSLANAGNSVSVKGSTLDWAEGDGNFVYLLTNMSGSTISITGSVGIMGDVSSSAFTGSLSGTASFSITSSYAIQTLSASYTTTASYAETSSYVPTSIGSLPVLIFTPLTGNSITLSRTDFNIINPAAGIASLIIHMPTGSDGDKLYVKFSENVTTTTWSGSSGQTVKGINNNGLVVAGSFIAWYYDSGSSAWL